MITFNRRDFSRLSVELVGVLFMLFTLVSRVEKCARSDCLFEIVAEDDGDVGYAWLG